MADNITLNVGSGGSVCAADDVSSVFYQRVKLTPGGDGAQAYGTTPYSYIAAAAANQDAVHPTASAGVVYGLLVTNSNAAVRYFKLYNKASGVTSADTPVYRVLLPAGGGFRAEFPYGMLMDTGIGFRLTTGYTDNDTGAVTAGDVLVNLEYV